MIQYMIENVEPIEELFFIYDENIEVTNVVINDKDYYLYPVQVGENTYYFKEGKGLWAKYYPGESVIKLYGEPQFAYRKFDE